MTPTTPWPTDPLVRLAGEDGSTFVLPASGLDALSHAARAAVLPGCHFGPGGQGLAADDCRALADFVQAGHAGAAGTSGPDVASFVFGGGALGKVYFTHALPEVPPLNEAARAAYAGCVARDPDLFAGPAAQALAVWLRLCGGFHVEAPPSPFRDGRPPVPSVN